MANRQEIGWINWVKCISIFLVYLYHTETRSKFHIVDLDKFFQPFFVNVFFIVSGYLLYLSQSKKEVLCLSRTSWYLQNGKKMLSNILFKICLPTILFSAIIYFPKMMLRTKDVVFSDFVEQVVFGHTMWFTWALAVGELLLFLLLLVRITSIYKVVVYGLLCMSISLLLSKAFNFPNFPWFYQSGLFSVFYLSMGALFLSIEKMELMHRNNKLKELFYIIGVVAVFCFIAYNEPSHAAINALKRYDFQGFVLSIVMSLLLIHYCRKLPVYTGVSAIGRNTLGLYMLSGAIPETVSNFFHKYFACSNVSILIVAVVSFLIGISLNALILRYMPYLYDFRKFGK